MRIIGKNRIFIGNSVNILNLARMEALDLWGNEKLNGKVIIGDNSSIGQCCHIIAADKLIIGKDCVISAFVYISDCSHQYYPGIGIMESNLITKKEINRIAVMGSMHEIGLFEGSIKENTPCNPVTPYGISKNTMRGLIEMLCKQKGITYQWTRGYYIVGNSKYGSSIFRKL